jgi:hypothetical protein
MIVTNSAKIRILNPMILLCLIKDCRHSQEIFIFHRNGKLLPGKRDKAERSVISHVEAGI